METERKTPGIKICGLRRPEDILAANRIRPDYIGFVFASKSRRYVTPEQAAGLKKLLDPSICCVGVFVNEEPCVISAFLQEGIIDAAQLHGQEDAAYIRTLRKLTDKPLIQAFRMEDEDSIAKINGSEADLVLLDHGNGGSGEGFDLRLLTGVGRPFYLAGGLSPETVTETLQEARKYTAGNVPGQSRSWLRGVDVSSGVETDGWKDPEKMQLFVSAVRTFQYR